MRKFLATLLFPVYIFAFSISLNSGAESGKPYSVLQLRDDVDFECVEQILAYDKKRYVCMIDDGVLPQISDTTLPLADIKYKKQDGFELYDKLSEEDRKALQAPINALAEDLAKLRGILGLK